MKNIVFLLSLIAFYSGAQADISCSLIEPRDHNIASGVVVEKFDLEQYEPLSPLVDTVSFKRYSTTGNFMVFVNLRSPKYNDGKYSLMSMKVINGMSEIVNPSYFIIAMTRGILITDGNADIMFRHLGRRYTVSCKI